MRRPLAFVLHATAAAIMAWGWLGLAKTGLAKLTGGYLLFLTNQGLALAWLCMAVSILSDVLPSVKAVRAIKRTLLALSLPLAFVVSTIYWTLILTFPNLILPSKDSPLALMRISLSTDLALHATPFVTLLIDFFAFESKFSKAFVRKGAPTAILVYAVWYVSFVEYCSPFNGTFPYPFLTYSPFPRRVLIYTVVAGSALISFRIFNALHP